MTTTSTPPPPPGGTAAPTAYASVGGRITAYLLDGLIPVLLLLPGYVVLFAVAVDTGTVVLLVGFLLTGVVSLYQWYGMATTGQSIGKRIVGIRVVDESTGHPIGWGRAFLRYLILGLLASVCSLLLLAQAFVIPGSPRRQGWHDRGARTVVLPADVPVPFAAAPAPRVQAPAGGLAPPPPPPPPPARPSLATGAAAAPPPVSSAPSPVTPNSGTPNSGTPEGTPPGRIAPVPPPPVVVPPPPPVVAPTPAPAPPAPAPPPPAPQAPPVPVVESEPVPESVPAEHTVLVDRPLLAPEPPTQGTPTTPWRLVADDGTTLALDGPVVVGREPSTDLVPGATALAVDDPQRTMSKTHAVLRATSAELTVEDLSSTNGVYLVDGAGSEERLPAGSATALVDGQRITFGDYAFVVERAR